jgi:hypothetical protein
LFEPAGFIIPDGRIVFIQFYFDLFVLVYLACLFSIANLDGRLIVHHSITFCFHQIDALVHQVGDKKKLLVFKFSHCMFVIHIVVMWVFISCSENLQDRPLNNSNTMRHTVFYQNSA